MKIKNAKIIRYSKQYFVSVSFSSLVDISLSGSVRKAYAWEKDAYMTGVLGYSDMLYGVCYYFESLSFKLNFNF